MLWLMRFSRFFSAVMALVVLSPSLQSFPLMPPTDSENLFSFWKASVFRNADKCGSNQRGVSGEMSVCDPSLVHVAITLDIEYLRSSIAAVHSILQHSLCSENIFFHFLVFETNLELIVQSTFPQLKFFDPKIVRNLISISVRQVLEQPLNYARNYLADLLEGCVSRVIYLDSDLVVVDDISKLWSTSLGSKTIGAPETVPINKSHLGSDQNT
ncbi:hypothetical protein QN277_005967 [Acacia crassicarpa]|uniref:Hexosyltransferase n=1 Tax=Acacia crassicarpa TaxID=499986 RepID=A0AAE1MAA0_9FABA|nr:hypothetical protein QN277_005967 [Acacia crassicarpa]